MALVHCHYLEKVRVRCCAHPHGALGDVHLDVDVHIRGQLTEPPVQITPDFAVIQRLQLLLQRDEPMAQALLYRLKGHICRVFGPRRSLNLLMQDLHF